MPNNIAGRNEEKENLLHAFNSNKAEFIILYGRRRIGKTFLIEELFSKKTKLFFHITGIQNGAKETQLKEFAKSIGKTFYHNASILPSNTWMDALEELTKATENLPKNKKVVLFFDEFPWMCTKKSNLIQALDYYWNRFWKNDKKIKLIICGSSASWIIRKILHHKGGLHNRNTLSILLKPFKLNETKLFFTALDIKFTHQQLVQIYMFCGGVPYYLNYIKKGKTASQMIDKMCFQENGILSNEFDKLFESLFDKAEVYKELIRIIAQLREGIAHSDIEDKSTSLSKGGTLSEKLKDLEDTAFIKSFIPLGHKRQGIYYRIIDEFCYFYLKWIEGAKKMLIMQERNNKYWSSKSNTPEYNSWMGYAFEAICYKHIREIRHALDINDGSRVGVWRYSPKKSTKQSGTQIDLVFDQDNNVTTLCEIKYTIKPFVIDKNYAEKLRNKIKIYQEQTRSKKQIHLVFITANGIKQNKYYHELVDNVVVLDDLFKDI